MRWQINPKVKDTYMLWEESLIVQHTLSGESLHITGIAKDIFCLLSTKAQSKEELLASLSRQGISETSDPKVLMHEASNIISQLEEKEIIEQCH